MEGLIENEASHKTSAFSVNLRLARNLLKFWLLQGVFFGDFNCYQELIIIEVTENKLFIVTFWQRSITINSSMWFRYSEHGFAIQLVNNTDDGCFGLLFLTSQTTPGIVLMLQVKIKFRLNFSTWVDSRFPLSLSPNSWIIRVKRQRKLRINLC